MRFSVPDSSSISRLNCSLALRLRIVLGDGEQAAERRRLLVGGGDRLLGRLRREQPRSRLGDLLEHAFFVAGVALHGFDEVGNQIVAPLQLVLDLRPLRLDRFFLADERVVRAAGQRKREQPQQEKLCGTSACGLHTSKFTASLTSLHRLHRRRCRRRRSRRTPHPLRRTPEPAAESAEAAAAPAAERTDAARPSAPRTEGPQRQAAAASAAAADAADDEDDDEDHDRHQRPDRHTPPVGSAFALARLRANAAVPRRSGRRCATCRRAGRGHTRRCGTPAPCTGGWFHPRIRR